MLLKKYRKQNKILRKTHNKLIHKTIKIIDLLKLSNSYII